MKNYIIALALVVPAASMATTISTFDSDADSWTMANIQSPGATYTSVSAVGGLNWLPTGGNTDGHISRMDSEGGAMHFKAPTAYTGDLSSYLGGTINFDIKSDFKDRTIDQVVTIKSGSNFFVGAFAPINNINVWESKSVTLLATNFKLNGPNGGSVSSAMFATALANVDAFYISGETSTGTTNETTALDNVSLEAVPEPATMTLLALGAVAAYRRKRSQA